MKKKKFGQLLRATREGADMTMGDLADALGVSVPYISDIERGQRAPLDEASIEKAARAMKVDADGLLKAAAVARRIGFRS